LRYSLERRILENPSQTEDQVIFQAYNILSVVLTPKDYFYRMNVEFAREAGKDLENDKQSPHITFGLAYQFCTIVQKLALEKERLEIIGLLGLSRKDLSRLDSFMEDGYELMKISFEPPLGSCLEFTMMASYHPNGIEPFYVEIKDNSLPKETCS
jgi:hypothetical protein